MFLCYVILHYMDSDTTIECIDSIIRTTTIEDYKIIVVDNASKNGSYERLLKYYENQTKIEWISNDKNYGFSKGNNIGYRYAKKKFEPEYILIGNNDLVFEQEEFVVNLKELGEKYPFYVAGPDIINLNEVHQSPYQMQLRPVSVVKKKLRSKKLFLAILKTKKALPFLRGINIAEKIYLDDGSKKKGKKQVTEIMKNVVLHGSCVIFSKRYIEEHEDAFPEYTFLYMEEELLALRCEKLGYDTYYFPQLKVKHKEDVSTNSAAKNELDKNIFVFTESIKAVNVYLKLVKKDVI